MAEAVTHQVGLVSYDSAVHAWVLDLPGCIAGAPSEAELHEPLRVAIAEHLGWLAAHGDRSGAIDPGPAWEVVERVDGTALADTGGEFAFDHDLEPLAEEELETLLARMEYSRSDLLAAVAAMPEALLDWAPEAGGRNPDPWSPEPRTVRQVLLHALQLELYYREGLVNGQSPGIFERVGEPADERELTNSRLRTAIARAPNRVYHPVRPGRSAAEVWTVRKAIRRIISHERAHAAEVIQRRTWALLGPPTG